MNEPFSECQVMIDYPNRTGNRVELKNAYVLYSIENGIPLLRIEIGKKMLTFVMDSSDIKSFKMNLKNLEVGKISLQFDYSYGNLCNIMISNPKTNEGLQALVAALQMHVTNDF